MYVKFKGTMTKWPVHKLTHRTTQKHVQHHDATDILKNYIFVFSVDLFVTASVLVFKAQTSRTVNITFEGRNELNVNTSHQTHNFCHLSQWDLLLGM